MGKTSNYIEVLVEKHRKVDVEITALGQSRSPADEFKMKRLKQEKLKLKEKIDQLTTVTTGAAKSA